MVCETTKDFMKIIEEQFINSNKLMANVLMTKISLMKCFRDGKHSVLAHMEMRDK